MKNLHLSLFIAGICIIVLSCSEREKPQPNILFIIADDMNDYGFLKSNEQVIAPHLDAFRKEAITFKHSYCPAPACSPSRSAFLSGLSPHRSGKYYNGSKVWDLPVFQNQETLMEWFQRVGYETYGYGKLFHSDISKERIAKNFPNGTGKGGFGPFPDEDHQVFGRKSRFRGVQAFPDEAFPDVINANAAIAELGKPQEKPFFMMYGLWRPHSPYTSPQRFLDLYHAQEIEIPVGYSKDDGDDLPEIAKAVIDLDSADFYGITQSDSLWKEYLKGYFAAYSFADDNIGRVLKALEASEHAENTIVIISSDNGFHMGEKDRFDKNSLWEQSAITPMAIRMPGAKDGGATSTAPVNLLDLFPTFVELCGNGISPNTSIDGKSIVPLLENPNSPWDHPSITYFGKDWVSVRNERFRYISYPDGSEELYDHDSDQWELENLADDPDFVSIKTELARYKPDQMVEAVEGRWTTSINKITKKVLQEK